LSGDGVDVPAVRKAMAAQGVNLVAMSDDQVRAMVQAQAEGFRDNAPTSAGQAAKIILDGVRAGQWRILVGKDAEFLDESVRAAPEDAYSQGFFDALVKQAQWRI